MIKPLQSITLKNDSGEDTTYVVASAPAIVETTEPAGVASFSDGAAGIPVKSLVADINPVQNLNGQSAPYPAGGGKNKYPISIGEDVWVNNANATHSNNNGELAIVVAAQINSGVYGNGQQRTLLNQQSIAKTVSMDIKASVAMSISVQSNVFNVSTSYQRISVVIAANTSASLSIYGRGTAGTIYVKNVAITEDGSTAYAPYSNICPITGWTGMNVTRTGANLWDEQWEHGYWSSSDGTKGGSTTQVINKNPIPVKPNTTYKVLTWQLRICQYKADGTFISATNVTNTTFTTDAECAYINFNTFNNNYGASDYRGNDIAILYPSTLTAYEPYNGTTYPISWEDEAGTVYGGTLDVTTGLLTVDMEIVDLGTLTWSYFANNKRFVHSLSGGKPTGTGYGGNGICSGYENTTDLYGTMPDKSISVGSNFLSGSTCAIVVHDEAYTNAAAFKTAMSGIQLVYELATPQTYQLTPQAVLTILGQNNIWADTGDVEVDYCADTKLYIDKVIAAL